MSAVKPRKGSWVMAVMEDTDPAEPRPHFVCQRCGERLITVLPIEISVYVAMGKAFVRSHSNCKERVPA